MRFDVESVSVSVKITSGKNAFIITNALLPEVLLNTNAGRLYHTKPSIFTLKGWY